MTNRVKQMKASGRQGGVALVVALVFLLAMTAIGVSSFVNTTLQERMVNSGRQADIAAQAAFVAQRAAEQWLQNNLNFDLGNISVFSLPGGCQGLYQPFGLVYNQVFYSPNPVLDYQANFANGFNYYDDQQWSVANSRSAVGVLTPGSVARDPRYIIELVSVTRHCGRDADCDAKRKKNQLGIGANPNHLFVGQFRVTAIGWGRDESIYRILQSTLRVELADDGTVPPNACPAVTT